MKLKELCDMLAHFAPEQCVELANQLEEVADDQLASDFLDAMREALEPEDGP